MPANLEIKATLVDPERALRRARELEPRPHSVERQVDTYFRVARGRLKLRRRWPVAEPGRDVVPAVEQPAELIAYGRSDTTGPKRSDYLLVPFPPGTRLEQVLELATGIDVRVAKLRTVFLHDDVRIHVDEVEGLGSFLELEAVLDETCDEEAAGRKIEALRRHFDIRTGHLIDRSYRELIGVRT